MFEVQIDCWKGVGYLAGWVCILLMMEIFQLERKSWFLPRSHFLQDPTVSTLEEPVFCHKDSSAITSQHFHLINILNYEQNLQTFKWRFGNPCGIIQIYSIEMLELVRTEARISVLCEKILFTVDEVMGHLNADEQFYVLKEVLEMARLLGGRWGCFRLTGKMVGFNKKGECKIWLNQNYACNDVQYPLGSEREQYGTLLEMFRCFNGVKKELQQFIWKVGANTGSFQTILRQLNRCISQKQVRVPDKVDMNRVVSLVEQRGQCRYSQLATRPSFTFKNGKESTQMSYSHKQCSMCSKDSIVPSQQSIDFNTEQKFKLRVPRRRRKLNSVNLGTQKVQKPSFSELKTKPIEIRFESSQASPVHSLGLNSKLQESIMIQSDVQPGKKPSFDVNSLEKLGKIGKFCQSLTPEEMILEQFKDIYQ